MVWEERLLGAPAGRRAILNILITDTSGWIAHILRGMKTIKTNHRPRWRAFKSLSSSRDNMLLSQPYITSEVYAPALRVLLGKPVINPIHAEVESCCRGADEA